MSSTDPFIFKLPDKEPLAVVPELMRLFNGSAVRPVLSTIILTAIENEVALEGEISSLEGGTRFYQANVLSNGLALSESLCIEVAQGSSLSIPPPDVRARKGASKSATYAMPEFVVPDETSHRMTVSRKSCQQRRAIFSTAKDDANLSTMRFEWLASEIHPKISKQGQVEDFGVPLEGLYAEINNIRASNHPKVESLLRLVDTLTSITDIDKASMDLKDLLQWSRSTKDTATGEGRLQLGQPVSVSPCLKTSVQDFLGLPGQEELHSIYEGIIRRWITPLSSQIPGHTRLAGERSVRNIAAQTCLASNTAAYLGPSKAR